MAVDVSPAERDKDHLAMPETDEPTSVDGRLTQPRSALAQWGMPSLTLSGSLADGQPDDEVFDQMWAVPDSRLIKDEIYQWTIDGVDIELRVRGRLLQRTRGPAHEPVATMATTSAVLGALAAGDTTIAAALESGGLILTGPAEVIRRMFIVTALPG